MDVTGTNVVAAQSMSADWAVTATEVAEAPTWDDGGEGRGMMLRIEGMEVVGKGEEGEEGEERALEELVEVWERRMGELRGVVGMGGRVGGVKGE